MFAVAFSNRLEALLDLLLERLAGERPGPFGRRELVVPSSAIGRRIELAVAEREGVAADLHFDYLAQWLWRQIGRVVPQIEERSPYAPALLAWRIYGLLEAGGGGWTAAHPRLAGYLAAADAPMRFELATRVARVFDHYLTYRPRWLAAWSEGRSAFGGREANDAQRADEAWQAELWRRLQAGMPRRREHPAAAFLRALDGMDAERLAGLGLPQRVHVFGLPALPPLYLELLRGLGRVVDVQLYTLNPCREYWFDVVDARRLSWLAARQADLFLDTGNRLLAAWGRQTQAHIDLLFEGEHEVAEEAAFVEHPGGHLLARLHNAILDLAELEPGSIELAGTDRSIEVHVCHSRTRELEVLHDRLLGLFDADPALRPADVLVLTPDLEGTAPLIEAVFGTAPATRRIPWRVTGLGGTRENAVAQALDGLLALAMGGRFAASEVFDLLQQPAVAARFGLDVDGLETVHEWMRGAGMHWGLRAGEAGHAAAWTLEEGLHRLYLGWAAGEAAVAAPFAGRIGAGLPEGNEALALGRLWRYVDTLRSLRDALLRPQDAGAWRRSLNDALDRLVSDDMRWADELREVRAAIAALTADMVAAGLGEALPPEVVRAALAARLDDPARGGVPGGSVTFSAMPALRGLPYEVVAIVGLDQGAFPGSDRADEFDLMAAFPHKGDRQRRLDDRNLFLDLLLAAREVLHLSYTGRSVRDGAELPPAVLVDELLDVLAAACAADPAEPAVLAAARRRLTVEHPLQPFSVDYFVPGAAGDPRLASYHDEYAAALAARLSAVNAAPPAAAPESGEGGEDGDEEHDEGGADASAAVPFFTAPLPPPEAAWRSVSLAQLGRFYRHPCRYLLRERLGLELPEGEEELADVEPFLPDWSALRVLAARLVPVLVQDGPPDADALFALARAGAEYPAGAIGEEALRAEIAALQDYAARLRAAGMGEPLPAHELRLALELDGEAWEFAATFADLRTGGRVHARYDDSRAGDYLAAWLAHLALCAGPPSGAECVTRGVARDGDFVLRPVAPQEARARLAELVARYRAGLVRPLHFYPKSAWAYVSEGASIKAALRKWSGGQRAEFGEAHDPAYRLALRGEAQPLDEAFFALAETVFGPLREYLEDGREVSSTRQADE
ncbi:exodeoxyribonuclease V subunit gamma [Pseudothauera rhizosphaerae]|uniref:RecBCD enzyme subunit RecC n=1 Tax=Pseudothauera rhizosphaerae TaxID=2565932 RepID=A0A4S4AK42_9RHOO|nr:exodeoxyribonuclease V subunit gamma [Pseudothauera rhizosphaerae]THF59379.1 exodeoxyribonuclease V subunit gamma [Pseudothauera rhizosphaerae]